MLRKTLSPLYWTDEFTVTHQNLDFLYSVLAEGTLGAPAPFDQLAISLIRECQERENQHIDKLLSLGTMYQPKDSYAVGQTLVFTALGYRTGEVTAVRNGYNPEYGAFNVIQVDLMEPSETVEFAAGLSAEHPLNTLDTSDLRSFELMSAEEIYEQYGEEIEDQIRIAFEEGERASEFLEWQGGWLLKDELLPLDEGSRNLAEAKMFMEERPVTAEEILAVLDLDTSGLTPELRDISLEVGLAQDDRFEAVFHDSESRWFSRNLMPETAQRSLPPLAPVPVHYQFSPLDAALQGLEADLLDEWSEFHASQDESLSFASFHLLYLHHAHGCLPVSSVMERLLDLPRDQKSLLEITDPLNGEKMACWYVPEARYIAGVEAFYAAHNIVPGARLFLQREQDGGLTLNYHRRRGRKEWIHMLDAAPDGLRANLVKSNQNIACEFNAELLVGSENAEGLTGYLAAQPDVKLFLLVEELVKEMVKGSGKVHAAAVYAAVNTIQRHPPAPVFHALISNSRLARDDDQVSFALNAVE